MAPCYKLPLDWRKIEIRGSQLLATRGRNLWPTTGEEEKDTHFPISDEVKRSLMVPPVTERNAAPQRPVTKRKKMRTASDRGNDS